VSAEESDRDDPIAAFNRVLSEILDVVQVAKQADRKVSKSHSLHDELDHLLKDLIGWAARLMEQDDALGVSALAFMPSQAGRHPRNPWPGTPTDEEVRALLGDLLGQLDQHLAAAMMEQTDGRSHGVLAEVGQQVRDHRRALTGNRESD
jgi:hypothetical protein